MNVTVEFATQIRRAAGTASSVVEVADGASVGDVLRTVAAQHGDTVGRLLLDDDGHVRPSVLAFAGDRQIRDASSTAVADGDVLTIMTPISGG